MSKAKALTMAGIGALIAAAGCGLYGAARAPETPWQRMPARLAHTDHAHLIKGPLEDAHAVTRTCLSCHPDSAKEVMSTSHWTWQGDRAERGGRTLRIGKRNNINNFCIGVQSNWPRCTSCHAGYGWKDRAFDFSRQENLDCLVCHDTTGAYQKEPAGAGYPAEDVDLLKAARSVGIPARDNCGYCHFSGGGGDAVKHGDLDGSMFHPTGRVDVHMGRHGFRCQDCHRTARHRILGRGMPVSRPGEDRVRCTDCHPPEPHGQDRLNAHTRTLACQACHLPFMAKVTPTKLSWDWSTAGQDIQVRDPAAYSKKKGSFTWGRMVPERAPPMDRAAPTPKRRAMAELPTQAMDGRALVRRSRPSTTGMRRGQLAWKS